MIAEASLSTSERRTLEALERHPEPHNLEWRDVLALLRALGTVEQRANGEWSAMIGGEHLLVRRPHGKDLTPEEVRDIRHFLAQVGRAPPAATSAADSGPDLLVAVDHHEARVFQLDLRPGVAAEEVIKPYDPHHFLHHLTHRDQLRQRGQRAAEDPSFYERIAQALAGAGPQARIVVVGHGAGHSDAGRHLLDWLHHHHRDVWGRAHAEITADLSSITPAQLLELGRGVLSGPRTIDDPPKPE